MIVGCAAGRLRSRLRRRRLDRGELRPASPCRPWSARPGRRPRRGRVRSSASRRPPSARAARRRARRRASAARGRRDRRGSASSTPSTVSLRCLGEAVARHVDQRDRRQRAGRRFGRIGHEEEERLRPPRRVRGAREAAAPTSALMRLDLPTLERPAKATSGGPSGGSAATVGASVTKRHRRLKIAATSGLADIPLTADLPRASRSGPVAPNRLPLISRSARQGRPRIRPRSRRLCKSAANRGIP